MRKHHHAECSVPGAYEEGAAPRKVLKAYEKMSALAATSSTDNPPEAAIFAAPEIPGTTVTNMWQEAITAIRMNNQAKPGF